MTWPQGRPLVPNPTGKGGFKPGHSGFDNGPHISAGKQISVMLGQALIQDRADGTTYAQQGCERIAEKFAKGEEWAVEFVMDRLVGKPKQTVAGDPEAPLVVNGQITVSDTAAFIAAAIAGRAERASEEFGPD